MKFKKNIKKGFTLVELIVVIAIVAILAAVSVVSYLAFINSANESADIQLVKQLNTCLQADEALHGKKDWTSDYKGMTDLLESNGFIVENLTKTKSGCDMVYQGSDKDGKIINRYALLKGDDVLYSETTFDKESNYRNLWIPETLSEAETLTNAGKGVVLGDELGEISEEFVAHGSVIVNNSTVTSIKYLNSSENKEVVIRTNSASTTLTIDDSSTGSIYHYGSAGALNIIQCHTASYHENGKVGFAEIAKGRIVLEKGADVEEIHINKKTASSFDTVIIANNGGAEELPERITRDAVTVSEETLVVKVESNGSIENVYVYANGTTGTTEKTSTQNSAVESDLGKLVLDNGSNPGEKAQTAEEKADAKDAAASEAVSADFERDPANANYVARIGQTGYYSLPDAIEVANASENPVTISLLKDVQQSGSLLIRNSISINGGNHIITTVGTATSGNMAAFDICDTNQKSPVIVNVKDLTISSTKHSRVFLLNGDYCSYDNTNILNVYNLIITTDGQALYSNGPATINARNCEIRHEGQYLSGKDAVYYSAIIVGYNGTLNIYDSKVSSFGNGASTFPSGGTINIYNTEITAFDDFVDSSTGYLFWARHEKSYDTGSYKDWCGSAIINVYSGVFEGPYKITHDGLTSANRIAAINIYGGTFEQDPSEYVQAGHSSQQNQDGTWTVK